MASDLVLDPGAAEPLDVWATADTVALINEARQFKDRLGAVFAIDRS
jgi:hypothetical protein